MMNYNLFNIKSFLWIIASLGTWIQGCDQGAAGDPFDREAMLKNIGEEALLPAHADFVKACEELDEAVLSFETIPTQAGIFEDIQVKWIAAKTAWKYCEIYNVGEAKANFLHNKIDKWPTKVEFLERNINGLDVLDEAFVEGSGSTSKGLAALEYLLFDVGDIATFIEDSIGADRMDYLVALSANLLTKAQELEDLWQGELDAFASDTENYSKGSLNELVNQQVGILEKILSDKLGKPMGKGSGGIPEPDEAEAHRSGISMSLVAANLEGLKASFLGATTRPGINDLLDHLEAKQGEVLLSVNILNQLEVCIAGVKAIEDPLTSRVVDQAQDLENVYEEIRTLLAMVKVDMANNLGILITFNETDGD